jgi:hypothetical protein
MLFSMRCATGIDLLICEDPLGAPACLTVEIFAAMPTPPTLT